MTVYLSMLQVLYNVLLLVLGFLWHACIQLEMRQLTPPWVAPAVGAAGCPLFVFLVYVAVRLKVDFDDDDRDKVRARWSSWTLALVIALLVCRAWCVFAYALLVRTRGAQRELDEVINVARRKLGTTEPPASVQAAILCNERRGEEERKSDLSAVRSTMRGAFMDARGLVRLASTVVGSERVRCARQQSIVVTPLAGEGGADLRCWRVCRSGPRPCAQVGTPGRGKVYVQLTSDCAMIRWSWQHYLLVYEMASVWTVSETRLEDYTGLDPETPVRRRPGATDFELTSPPRE